jgi:hypothetical protein
VFFTVLRFALYGIGAIGAALLAGRLFAINHILAKLWGVSQLVWIFICSILITMLMEATVHPEQEVNRIFPMTVVAVLLAACPLIIYLRWGRNGDLE